MDVNKKKLFIFIFILINVIESTTSQIITINMNELDDSTKCYNIEKTTIEDKGEIIYEILNNKLDKIIFIQFNSLENIVIYRSNIEDSNIIFSQKKEENNFENHYFNIDNNVEKYIIKIKILQKDVDKFKICFNSFDAKESSFKEISGKTQKIASYEIINSGKFPFFIKDNLSPFTSLRINKKYEKLFTINKINIKAKIIKSEEIKEINLDINEFFDNEDYQYIFWNLDINKIAKLEEILIEIYLNVVQFEEGNNKFELELINNQEIHFEYYINTKKIEDSPKIYYINLKKNLFDKDLDILCFSNVYNGAIYISDSYNINKENSVNIDRMFFILNKNYLELEKFKNIKNNPSLLFIIIDEKFIYSTLDLVYNFIFAGSSRDKYQYREDITKPDLFKKNKLIINSKAGSTFFLINYFSDFDEEYIIDFEPVMGNVNIYYTNQINGVKNLTEYLDNIESYPIQNMKNSIISGDFGLFEIKCEPGIGNVLSYLNIYKKNEINDVIYFQNQKTLLFLQKDETHSFTFDSDILNEQFSFKIRILKKDEGKFTIDINYNNFVYKSLTENNFIELKHEKGDNPIIYISVKETSDNKKKSEKGIILEIIKNINIDNNLMEIKKSNIFNSILQPGKFLFIEYDKKDSTQIKLTLYNKENDETNICIHTGYGIHPYLNKPECDKEELIILRKDKTISLIYSNPFLNNEIKNINSYNHFYIGLYTDKKITYDLLYEKHSVFNSIDGYKSLDFNGKEIIQLDNNKRYPYIYYQINICQDFSNSLKIDSLNPSIFNYYFEDKKDEIILNNIKTDIYKSYKINNINKKLSIIFTKDESIKGKFKYIFSPISIFNLKENYSKDITTIQTNNSLKIFFETPFQGNLIVYFLFIVSNFDKYDGLCPVIDLFEDLKNNMEAQNNYSDKLYKTELYTNKDTNLLNIEIESNNILGINRKDARLYVINTLKMINMDIFYNPYNLHISFNDHFTEIENDQNSIKILVIICICLIIIFLIFILYRQYQRKTRINNIDYNANKMRLAGDVNETNKLF